MDDEVDLLNRANMSRDVFDDCHISNEYISHNTTFKFEFHHNKDRFTKQIRNQLMNILEINMKDYYEKTWGWDIIEKTNEIFAGDSKFIIIRNVSNEIVAWCMFKFDWDDLDGNYTSAIPLLLVNYTCN